MSWVRRSWLMAWTALCWSGAALAHHSTAAYDYTKTTTLNGVVREFQWSNPHCYIQLLIAGADGQQQEWSIESGTPSLSTRLGWSKDSVKAGDKVTVVLSPMRDGTRAGTLRTITLQNGKILRGAAANVKTDKAGTPDLVPTLPSLQRATPKQP
ncbi:MAG: hypothetical protein JWL65_232 [Gammaproteobacteria bacterium]|nr:hypothetical protein [Gammaproteobacteria bacterium]